MIEFRNVSKTYDTGTEAVHKANFNIEKGEFAFLVGTSGSGKSTLIKLILKEENPTSGNIIINGKDTTYLKPKRVPYLRRSMGVVFQDFCQIRLFMTMLLLQCTLLMQQKDI